jgi:hypothetical protein
MGYYDDRGEKVKHPLSGMSQDIFSVVTSTLRR